MIAVTRAFEFEAAHRLPGHPGRCASLHGHRYRLEVTASGAVDESGMVVDFEEIERLVARLVLDEFDHSYLNDIIPNPTAELIGLEVRRRLVGHLRGLSHIRLWETSDTYVDIGASDS